MSIDARLSRLAPALSARERAILVLGSLKNGTPEDPDWRRFMPQDQVREFNRYIGLMNVANRELGIYIGMAGRTAVELGIKQAWLISLTLWQEHIDEIGRAMRITLREPITESAYRAQEAEVRAEWVPLVEAAEMLAGDQDDWREEDFVEGEDGTREISDAAWDRVVGEKQREVRALVEAGKLTVRGKGRRLAVQFGSFNDLVWHKAGLVPEDYLRYRVLPDEQAEDVEGEREGLRRLQSVLDWRADDADKEPELPAMPTRMIDALRQGMAGALIKCWIQLRTAEVVLSEIAVEFGGTDPLKPALREEVEETKRELLTIQEHLRFLSMEVVLREPLEEELDEMRGWVKERAAI